MAPTLVLIAVLSIALPLAFIAVLLRLVNRVPPRARRAEPPAGAPGLGMGPDAGTGDGLDNDLDMAGLGQDAAIRGPGRAPGRPMP